jgi:hypothetical protein
MRRGILCPLFGDRPNSVREIELLPLQTSDFLSALSCECQKFDNNPIWSTDLSGARDLHTKAWAASVPVDHI